jgi:hypothetical protein
MLKATVVSSVGSIATAIATYQKYNIDEKT